MSNDIADVFAETVSAAVVSQIHDMEQAEFAQPANLVADATTVRQETRPSSDMAEQVHKLKELRDNGTITEDEYQKMVLRAADKAE